MRRRARRIAALLGIAAGVSCAGDGARAPQESLSVGRMLMGTVLELTLFASDPRAARVDIDAEFAQVAELEGLMSRHDPHSQLSALNASAGAPPRSVDPRLYELVEEAVELAELTDGAFDVTIGALVEVWVEAVRRDHLPSNEELQRARSKVGASRIQLERGKIGLPEPGMSIDLGGIAKGYALDAVSARLLARGHRNALLNFGQSSVHAMGAPPEGGGWRLLMPSIRGAGEAVLNLSDRAMSISSSFGQSSEIAGQRFGHIIDPRSGSALRELRRSVVVAPSATLAEALSTALIVLDVAKGLAIAEAAPGVEALIEDPNGVLGQTTGWQRTTGHRLLQAAKRDAFSGAEADSLAGR